MDDSIKSQPAVDNKTTATILLLVFLYPIGVVYMWVVMKRWPTWLKLILSINIIIFFVALALFTTLLTATGLHSTKQNTIEQIPTAQHDANYLTMSRDAQRKNDIALILSGLNQYQIDHNNQLPPSITTVPQEIAKTAHDICSLLVPAYMHSLPVDPLQVPDAAITDCKSDYKTGYTVSKNARGETTVQAPKTEAHEPYTVSR